MEELIERIRSFKDSFDLRAKVAANPWQAIGIAALAGAWLGYAPPRFTRTRSKIGETMLAFVGAITLRLVREAAFREVANLARHWWEEAAAQRQASEVGAYGET